MNHYKIALIGAGQIGSRHLQGILRFGKKSEIYVTDPSLASLATAKQRIEDIEHTHQVFFKEDMDSIPDALDLVIVATNADIRARVIESLLSTKKVKSLVLEKVLFQKVEDYAKVEKLLAENEVKCWVNHSMRLYPFYNDVKGIIAENRIGPLSFELFGQNWGLGCNALHWIDIFIYLSGEQLDSVSSDSLDDEIHASKREGFYEFSGTITGKLSSGSLFTVTSLVGSDLGTKQEMLSINGAFDRFVIKKGGETEIFHFAEKDQFQLKQSKARAPYQSELTGAVVEGVLSNGHSPLPTYREACQTHIPFVKALTDHYSKVTGKDQIHCPIT